MLIVFAYSYRQADVFISKLRDANHEIRSWKRVDFKIVTEDHIRAYRGYKCDVVFLYNWTEKVMDYQWRFLDDELQTRFYLGDFTDKTEEYFKLINSKK